MLRFFAFKNDRLNFKHDLSLFLTSYMEKVSDPEMPLHFDYEAESEVFKKTFKILELALGDFAFGIPKSDNLVRQFGVYQYEAITLGLQAHLAKLEINNAKHIQALKEALEKIKVDKEFSKNAAGGGQNTPRRLTGRIEFVESQLGEMLASIV